MKALLIDHDDSFTQNLKHWLLELFQEVIVINHRHFQALDLNEFDLIILSPGPKHPKDYDHILKFLKTISSSLPVFGVCLGLQMMALACDEIVETYQPPLHGKTSKLKILNTDYTQFEELKVARYHSLKINLNSNSESNFKMIAESSEDSIPMWLEHKNKKWLGVQFHPESFLTEQPHLHLKALSKWLQK